MGHRLFMTRASDKVDAEIRYYAERGYELTEIFGVGHGVGMLFEKPYASEKVDRFIKAGVTTYGKDVFVNTDLVTRLVEVHHPQTDEWETWIYTTDALHSVVVGRSSEIAAVLNG